VNDFSAQVDAAARESGFSGVVSVDRAGTVNTAPALGQADRRSGVAAAECRGATPPRPPHYLFTMYRRHDVVQPSSDVHPVRFEGVSARRPLAASWGLLVKSYKRLPATEFVLVARECVAPVSSVVRRSCTGYALTPLQSMSLSDAWW
jgi:hypothetical protein